MIKLITDRDSQCLVYAWEHAEKLIQNLDGFTAKDKDETLLQIRARAKAEALEAILEEMHAAYERRQ